MRTKIISVIICILMMLSLNTYAKNLDTLCTPNPSKEAIALFRYLQDMYGEKTLAGQMWVPWGNDGLDYIETITGKLPAIMGIDFITESDNPNGVQKAINWWKNGGITTAMWHWGAPGVGEGYDNSKATIKIDSCFVPGTKAYIAFWAELKTKADWLQKFRDAHVPVLWRPFHELNGGWFWWSKEGAVKFKKLWTTMFNYFVHDRGLNNLIWVLCYDGSPDKTWYPGKQYVDIVGADTYGVGSTPQTFMFNQVKKIVGNDSVPIAYHECGVPPDPDLCFVEGAMWSWWMEWHTDYLFGVNQTYLNKVYNHNLVITLDELPKIDSVYGWDSTCIPTAIIPNIKIGSGSWQQTSKVGKYNNPDSTVILSPVASGIGKWRWSGCGISDTAREQTIVVTDFCTATATFVNECGATSTQTFNVYNDCTPTTIIPHLKVDGGNWIDTSRVTINSGSSVTLRPQPDTGGSWKWSGCGITDSLRELTIIPINSCNPVAAYTNFCGKISILTFRIIVSNGTEISNTSEISNIIIYPNPANEGVFRIKITNLSNRSQLKIFDVQGRLRYYSFLTKTETEINTGLTNGIYIIKIINGQNSFNKKLVVK